MEVPETRAVGRDNACTGEVGLSIVLPCYRAAEILARHLPDLMAFVERRYSSHEIILVDDGSDDQAATERIAKRLGCVFLQHKRNLGKGAAVRTGMLHARGHFRIFTDADIPFGVEVIEQFVHELDLKGFDIVVGDRTLEGALYPEKIAWVRKVTSRLYSFFVRHVVRSGMFDTQCGLKGFRAGVADDLFSVTRIDGFAFDVELIYIARKRNYAIQRLPVRLHNDWCTSVRLVADGADMLLDLLVIKWNSVRGRYTKRGPREVKTNSAG